MVRLFEYAMGHNEVSGRNSKEWPCSPESGDTSKVTKCYRYSSRQKTGTGTDGSDLSSQPEGHGFEPRFGKSERQASIHSGDKVESLKHVDRN